MVAQQVISLAYDRNIYLELLDARSIKVTTNCAFIQPTYNENRNIVSLNFSNQYSILNGMEITFVIGVDFQLKTRFTVNQIKQFDGYYVLYSHKRTKSSYFVLPALGYNKEYFKWNQFFINSYTKYDSYKHKGNYLYLLYKYMPLKQYDEFEKTNMSLNTFVEIIQPKCKDEVIFVHKIEDKFDNDIDLFHIGKYSELSTLLKKRILFFHNSNKDSELGQIIYKDEKRRKQLEMDFLTKIPIELELWDIPDIEDETLIIEE